MKKIFYTLTIFFIFIFSKLYAQIAILPFEDLSKDLNGINFTIAEKVAEKLEDLGFEVITPYELEDFLSENSIYYTGWIDSLNAKKIGKQFHCSLILIGTILENNHSEPFLGLNVRILSINKFKLIWGKTIFITKANEITFLNINKKKWEDIQDKAITSLIKNMPKNIGYKSILDPDITIDHFSLYPKYSSSKTKIFCNLKFKSFISPPEKLIFIIDNSTKVLPEIKKNNITATWPAPKKEGRHNLTLYAKWKFPKKISKKIFLTSFYVDNKKPDITLKIKRGVKIKGEIYFNKFIKIIPVIKNRDKISHWEFSITPEKEEKPILIYKQYMKLPKFLYWRGVTNRGGIIPNGKYIIKLKVFDMANNMSEAAKKVFVVKSFPHVIVSAKKDKNFLNIKLEFKKKHLVKISSWNFELFDEFGNLIASKYMEGDLKNFNFSNKLNKMKLFYSIEIKDILGNRLFLKKRKLLIKKEQKEKIKKKKIWINDF